MDSNDSLLAELSGLTLQYLEKVVRGGHSHGNGPFTKACQEFLEKRYSIPKCLLTTSCTDALEMAAMLLDIRQGDEVILPSFTFSSPAIAFLRQGANLVFVDSYPDRANLDTTTIEQKITKRTKVIIATHYAGISDDLEKLRELANKHKIFLVEDAAQCIESKYKERQLGTFGDLGCISFHATKNLSCGEGGVLFINNPKFIERAEIIWEKGTNRAAYFRGEVDKYHLRDVGSSFLPSEYTSAVLLAQLQNIERIQKHRVELWNIYRRELHSGKTFRIPTIPVEATPNGHIFYLLMKNKMLQKKLLKFLKSRNISASFHFQALHLSPMFKSNADKLPFASHYAKQLVRLPLSQSMSHQAVEIICKAVKIFDEHEGITHL